MVLGQYDNYHWPVPQYNAPQGPRYHFNPALSLPIMKPWGYVTPTAEFIENAYEVHYESTLNGRSFNRLFTRFSIDTGLTFERSLVDYTQTLEPRLYYLYTPYRNQTPIPVYESGYMIFNTDQLFRNNRFSGFDRIGDANQLSYAVTTRFLSDNTGQEKASLSVGQIRYFSTRRVELCYQQYGTCTDNPLNLGYISPLVETSPIASHGSYRINSVLSMTGDYVYDVYAGTTNNADLNLHYQPAENRLLSAGYAYIENGNLLPSALGSKQNNALHQATIGYATPFTDKWSGLGVYSYNISKGYSMLALLGVQYDNCCWAARLIGGRTFMSLSPNSLQPTYNNNVYFQVLLKGLGSVASSDPSSIIQSYLPGLRNIF